MSYMTQHTEIAKAQRIVVLEQQLADEKARNTRVTMAHMNVVDAAQAVVDAYINRFGGRPDELYGPIDDKVRELREALK